MHLFQSLFLNTELQNLRRGFHWSSGKPILHSSRGTAEPLLTGGWHMDSWSDTLCIAKWSATILGRSIIWAYDLSFISLPFSECAKWLISSCTRYTERSIWKNSGWQFWFRIRTVAEDIGQRKGSYKKNALPLSVRAIKSPWSSKLVLFNPCPHYFSWFQYLIFMCPAFLWSDFKVETKFYPAIMQ